MKKLLAAAVILAAAIQLSAKDTSLKSPGGTLSAVLNTTGRVSLEISREGNPLFSMHFPQTLHGALSMHSIITANPPYFLNFPLIMVYPYGSTVIVSSMYSP